MQIKKLIKILSLLILFGCTDVLVGGSIPTSANSNTGGEPNPAGSDNASDGEADDSEADSASGNDSDSTSGIEACEVVDTYDSLGTVCFIDSVDGDDANDGTTAETPLRTQTAIGPGCVVARFKRGSRFDAPLRLLGNVQVYTNYGDPSDPLPRFVVSGEPMSGPVVNGMMFPGITIDGLYLAGARGDGTIENIYAGMGLFLGANSTILNSEITDCEVGAMLTGSGSLVQGNYVHDLVIGVDPDTVTDPNLRGGAVGVFINAANVDISYNTFINCLGAVDAENGSCDGGATEITINACDTVSDVQIHHNYSYNNCGFFGVATTAGECKGAFSDSNIYHNVIIDSAWFGFLQVNNTNLGNIHLDHNTHVHHADSMSAGVLWVIFTGSSSGWTGGALVPATVFLANNLFVFDDITPFGPPIDDAFEQTTNLVIYTDEQDPGFVDMAGTAAADFDLTRGSPAIDQGTLLTQHTLDFLHRTIPDPGGAPDIGAFEFGSSQGECLPSRMPQ